MNDEELKAACVMTGLDWDDHYECWACLSHLTNTKGGQRQRVQELMDTKHPALSAYVASLLVAKVNTRSDFELYRPQLGVFSTDEQRIKACLEVLT